MRSADISREIYPAVNLDLAVFPSLPARSFVNCLHQWIRRELTRVTDDWTPTDLPIAGGKRRGIERRRWNTAWAWGVGIGGRVCRRAQLFQKRFSQALHKRFV